MQVNFTDMVPFCDVLENVRRLWSQTGYHLLSLSFEVVTSMQQQFSFMLPSGSVLCQISVVCISSWKAVKKRKKRKKEKSDLVFVRIPANVLKRYNWFIRLERSISIIIHTQTTD